MLRAMAVDVSVQTVEPTPTAVVAAATTWADPDPTGGDFDVQVFWSLIAP
jgi:hypothetical protein